MRIRDGSRTLSVKVLKPEAELYGAKKQVSGIDRLRRSWLQSGEAFGWRDPKGNLVHSLPWTAEDYAIAKRLSLKLDWKRIDEITEVFFWLYSEPLRQGYTHPLVLFAHSLPSILANLPSEPTASIRQT